MCNSTLYDDILVSVERGRAMSKLDALISFGDTKAERTVQSSLMRKYSMKYVYTVEAVCPPQHKNHIKRIMAKRIERELYKYIADDVRWLFDYITSSGIHSENALQCAIRLMKKVL